MSGLHGWHTSKQAPTTHLVGALAVQRVLHAAVLRGICRHQGEFDNGLHGEQITDCATAPPPGRHREQLAAPRWASWVLTAKAGLVSGAVLLDQLLQLLHLNSVRGNNAQHAERDATGGSGGGEHGGERRRLGMQGAIPPSAFADRRSAIA